MEKKRIVWLVVGGLIFTLGGFLIFLNFSKKPEVSTDIEGLYSSFTDYMKETVDSRLQYLECKPTQYYEKESHICFICDTFHPCFGYGWVRMNGQMRNPKGAPFIVEAGELNVKFVDFCYEGLASDLECKKGKDYNKVECGEVSFVNKSRGNQVACNKVKIEMKRAEDFQDFAKEFCEIKKEKIVKITESYVVCGEGEGCDENLEVSSCGEGEGCNETIPFSLCGKHIVIIQDEEIILFEK